MLTMTKKTGPLHHAVHEAQGSLNGTQVLVEKFKKELEELRAKDQDLGARIEEGLIAEEIGTAPADDVASLRRERLELAESIERKLAGLKGFERKLKSEVEVHAMAASANLRVAKMAWVQNTAKEIRERIDQVALDFQQAQRQAIALVRLLNKLKIKAVNEMDLNLLHVVYAEIVSSHGGGPESWPKLGDRKTANEVVASQMETFLEQLQGL